jgi:hypothetical protein
MAGTHVFSVSKNFSYVGGDTVEELHANLVAFNSNPNLAAEIAAFDAVTSGRAPNVQQATQNLASAGVVQQPVQPAQPAAPVPAVNAGSGPVVQELHGAKWTINHPDAPVCPDGTRAVLKEWTAQKTGRESKAWKHQAWMSKEHHNLDHANKEFNVWAN